MDQIKAVDRLMEALADRGVGGDLSTHDLVDSLDEAGLRFCPGNQCETLKRLKELDADAQRSGTEEEDRSIWEVASLLADAVRGLDSYAASSRQVAPLERTERARKALAAYYEVLDESAPSLIAVTEDPVREATREFVRSLDESGLATQTWFTARAGSLREALAKPVPPSLTEDERKAVVLELDVAIRRESEHGRHWQRVESAREKLS